MHRIIWTYGTLLAVGWLGSGYVMMMFNTVEGGDPVLWMLAARTVMATSAALLILTPLTMRRYHTLLRAQLSRGGVWLSWWLVLLGTLGAMWVSTASLVAINTLVVLTLTGGFAAGIVGFQAATWLAGGSAVSTR